MILCISGIPLEKMKFSFVSSCQSALTPELGMGAHVCLLPSELGPHLGWTCAGPIQAACFCESALLCPEGTVSMLLSLPSGSYNLPTASSTELSLEGRSLMATSLLGPDVRRSLAPCASVRQILNGKQEQSVLTYPCLGGAKLGGISTRR